MVYLPNSRAKSSMVKPIIDHPPMSKEERTPSRSHTQRSCDSDDNSRRRYCTPCGQLRALPRPPPGSIFHIYLQRKKPCLSSCSSSFKSSLSIPPTAPLERRTAPSFAMALQSYEDGATHAQNHHKFNHQQAQQAHCSVFPIQGAPDQAWFASPHCP